MSDSDLPNAIVNRIIKSSLPENVAIAKDSKLAISKAAKIWIHYLTAASIDFSQNAGRSTLLPKDVLQALEELDFESFKAPLEEFFSNYKIKEKEKEKKKEEEKKEREKENKDKENKDKDDNDKDDDENEDEKNNDKDGSDDK
ncbi:hypothetical protein DICPUDRAFT_92261 [Dictyostelium purpureum]|uniref:Transcription factor CBF/NF-Y/archaeal histone domain-containing protein n=1 Tax=Dictyostelium purpureum TaxID=5786 RepID=F0ZP82_DICPU|nr:uncharacterized protein DICPUDRAFT_92261 [Dictyostelium purpureum]EGC34260.1 hypothetical protein DICPUDRAFT_92261 [Dictyostelium purpureum]|eukprot:XP_003289229.1 hypothetical protein DICPUDRAFT_92261 [Dictyostelium purpureum]